MTWPIAWSKCSFKNSRGIKKGLCKRAKVEFTTWTINISSRRWTQPFLSGHRSNSAWEGGWRCVLWQFSSFKIVGASYTRWRPPRNHRPHRPSHDGSPLWVVLCSRQPHQGQALKALRPSSGSNTATVDAIWWTSHWTSIRECTKYTTAFLQFLFFVALAFNKATKEETTFHSRWCDEMLRTEWTFRLRTRLKFELGLTHSRISATVVVVVLTQFRLCRVHLNNGLSCLLNIPPSVHTNSCRLTGAHWRTTFVSHDKDTEHYKAE